MQSLDLFIHTDRRQSAVILPEDGAEIGYGSLSDQVDRLAARLRQSGLDPGQVVAIALPNEHDGIYRRSFRAFRHHAVNDLVLFKVLTYGGDGSPGCFCTDRIGSGADGH